MDLHSVRVGVRIYQKFKLPHNLAASLGQGQPLEMEILFEREGDTLAQAGFDPWP
jgi:hypothetical protein